MMYIPHHYKEEDRYKLIAFIRSHSFGVLVSAGEKGLHGTHLPFVVEEQGKEIVLLTHMAKANPQWQHFSQENDLLAIFTGPHGYVSPSNYEKEQNVPTWNYVAVHAYGRAALLSDQDKVEDVLAKMIVTYEEAYRQQWEKLSRDYKNKMIKGIVAFEIKVTRLEGKCKLSQNKTEQEQKNIIQAFEKQKDFSGKEVAELMKKNISG